MQRCKNFQVILLSLVLYLSAFAQTGGKYDWREILMQNYNNSWFYASSKIEPPNAISTFVPHGGQAALDNNHETCWAEGVAGPGIGEELWFEVPEEMVALNIINGFMKSKENFVMNNRVETFSIRIYLGIYSTGRDYGGERRFYLTPLTDPVNHTIEDHGNPQRVLIDYPYKDFMQRKESAFASFQADWKGKHSLKSTLFAVVRILSYYPGSFYDDTSISEIKIIREDLENKIINIYVSEAGDALLIDTPRSEETIIDSERGSSFLLLENTPDRKWAIILIIAGDNWNEGAKHVLYHLPSKTRYAATQIDPACDKILGFENREGEFYVIYQNERDFESKSLQLSKLQK